MENPDLVFQETGDSQGPTHSRPAECGSREAIQARPDDSDTVVCPYRGLSGAPGGTYLRLQQQTSIRFNNKLPQFVSPVPDPLAWAVEALSLSWEDLDPYAFPPIAIFGKVLMKLQDYPFRRIIRIAPGWPNMP